MQLGRTCCTHATAIRLVMPGFCQFQQQTLPSQSILLVGSSGRAVEQSTTVCTPTSAAGSDIGSLRSACAGTLASCSAASNSCDAACADMPVVAYGWKADVPSLYLHGGGAPIAQEVCWVLPRPHRAADLIPLIQRPPHHLIHDRQLLN